jgi:hypothetical protein
MYLFCDRLMTIWVSSGLLSVTQGAATYPDATGVAGRLAVMKPIGFVGIGKSSQSADVRSSAAQSVKMISKSASETDAFVVEWIDDSVPFKTSSVGTELSCLALNNLTAVKTSIGTILST